METLHYFPNLIFVYNIPIEAQKQLEEVHPRELEKIENVLFPEIIIKEEF
jgi:hypothetical protein